MTGGRSDQIDVPRSLLDLTNRVRALEATPVFNGAVQWVYAEVNVGSVADSSPYPFSGGPVLTDAYYNAGSITHQTDGGQVYDSAVSGGVDNIRILQIGTYLVRCIGQFGEGHTGYAMASADLAGSIITYDYNVEQFQPLSYPDTMTGTDMGAGGGTTFWEQLMVVTAAPAFAHAEVWQSSGGAIGSVLVDLQIFRFTQG